MPNYCYNSITIRGEKKHIDHIKKICNSYDNYSYFNDFGDDLLKIKRKKVTEPEKRGSIEQKYGTRFWDFSLNVVTDSCLEISGDSAWSPPLILFQNLSEKYDLHIEGSYSEPGMDFAGEFSIVNGEYEWHNEMTCQEQTYNEDFHTFYENYVIYNEPDDYDSFDDFLKCYNIDFKSDELDIIRDYYYNNKTNLELTMEEKTKILKDLDEIGMHLSNLSMEKLSIKMIELKDRLEKVWNNELKNEEV